MSFSLFSKLFEFRGRALSFSSAFTWDHASAWAWTPARAAMAAVVLFPRMWHVPGRADRDRAGSAPMELPSATGGSLREEGCYLLTSAWLGTVT